MTYYLRTKEKKNLCEINVYIDKKWMYPFVEIHSSVCIANYSLFLLEFSDQQAQAFIIAFFDHISELRGWLWEKYFATRQNTSDEFDNVKKEVKNFLDPVAEKFGLYVVED